MQQWTRQTWLCAYGAYSLKVSSQMSKIITDSHMSSDRSKQGTHRIAFGLTSILQISSCLAYLCIYFVHFSLRECKLLEGCVTFITKHQGIAQFLAQSRSSVNACLPAWRSESRLVTGEIDRDQIMQGFDLMWEGVRIKSKGQWESKELRRS